MVKKQKASSPAVAHHRSSSTSKASGFGNATKAPGCYTSWCEHRHLGSNYLPHEHRASCTSPFVSFAPLKESTFWSAATIGAFSSQRNTNSLSVPENSLRHLKAVGQSFGLSNRIDNVGSPMVKTKTVTLPSTNMEPSKGYGQEGTKTRLPPMAPCFSRRGLGHPFQDLRLAKRLNCLEEDTYASLTLTNSTGGFPMANSQGVGPTAFDKRTIA